MAESEDTTEKDALNDTTTLSSSLNFYSDRANAHASFMIAGFFGIYTILFAETLQIAPLWLFWIVLVSISGFIFYSLLNFSYYTTVADMYRAKLLGKHVKIHHVWIDKYLEPRRDIHWFYNSKESLHSAHGVWIKILCFATFYVLSVVLPALWVTLHYLIHNSSWF